VAALLHRLGDLAEFSIVTRDRDLADRAAYPGVLANQWTTVAGVRVRYLSPAARNPWTIARLLRAAPHDLLYVNTLFSIPFGFIPLLLRRIGAVRRTPLVLAPRGQLNPGALLFSPWRKRAFLSVARGLGLFRDVRWQATSEHEMVAIRNAIGAAADVNFAPNMRIAAIDEAPPRLREPGDPLRVIFLSRISPKKNLDGALRILSGVRAPITFDVYGVREDAAYWSMCEQLIQTLPANVAVRYCGVLPGAAVKRTLRAYDVMLLPTHDENFGHVIAEALEAGCPPLISDRTPWRGLVERGVGWDLALEDLDGFRAVLEACATEDPSVSASRSGAASAWVAGLDEDADIVERNASLLGIQIGTMDTPASA